MLIQASGMSLVPLSLEPWWLCSAVSLPQPSLALSSAFCCSHPHTQNKKLLQLGLPVLQGALSFSQSLSGGCTLEIIDKCLCFLFTTTQSNACPASARFLAYFGWALQAGWGKNELISSAGSAWVSQPRLDPGARVWMQGNQGV